MTRTPSLLAAAAALFAGALLSPAAGHAAGPVDAELSAFYWDNDFKIDGAGLSEDSAADPGFRGELWFAERFGFVAQYLSSDTGDISPSGDDVTYAWLDFRIRAVGPTENNFLAFGIGWQQADLGVTPAFGDTSGPRLSAYYRFGAEVTYGYAELAWMPAMDDIDAAGVIPDLEDVEGWEYEVGVSIRLFPFTRLKLAYHRVEFDMSRAVLGGNFTSRSDGLLAGLGVRF